MHSLCNCIWQLWPGQVFYVGASLSSPVKLGMMGQWNQLISAKCYFHCYYQVSILIKMIKMLPIPVFRGFMLFQWGSKFSNCLVASRSSHYLHWAGQNVDPHIVPGLRIRQPWKSKHSNLPGSQLPIAAPWKQWGQWEVVCVLDQNVPLLESLIKLPSVIIPDLLF